MHRMHRALGILTILALAIAMAACAAPGTGGGTSSDDPTSASTTGSAEANMPSASGAVPSDGASAAPGIASGDGERVSIDDLLADPSLFADREITVSENIDEVFVEGQAFLFSGTEVEGQLLVVVTPDAPIEKEIEVDRVVTATGMVVPLTAEDLEAAGVPLDDEIIAAVEGNAVLVATAISDPLAGS